MSICINDSHIQPRLYHNRNKWSKIFWAALHLIKRKISFNSLALVAGCSHNQRLPSCFSQFVILATVQTLIFFKGGQWLRDVHFKPRMFRNTIFYAVSNKQVFFSDEWLWIIFFLVSLSDSTKYTDTSLSICSQGSRP